MTFQELQDISRDCLIEISDSVDIERYLNSQQVTSWDNGNKYLSDDWIQLATFSPCLRLYGHSKNTVMVCRATDIPQ